MPSSKQQHVMLPQTPPCTSQNREEALLPRAWQQQRHTQHQHCLINQQAQWLDNTACSMLRDRTHVRSATGDILLLFLFMCLLCVECRTFIATITRGLLLLWPIQGLVPCRLLCRLGRWLCCWVGSGGRAGWLLRDMGVLGCRCYRRCCQLLRCARWLGCRSLRRPGGGCGCHHLRLDQDHTITMP
jgi:hypothetical protein